MSTPRSAYLFLAIGVVAASQSGNLIRIGTAHPLAIVSWRLLLATAVLAVFAGRELAELARLAWRDVLLVVLAGLALAGHLATWTAAVQSTTVANAAVFFAVNPVLTALAAYFFFGDKVGVSLGVAMGLGLTGVVVLGSQDLQLEPSHLRGDLLALTCAALFSAYFLIGRRLRRSLSTATYVTAVYGSAALLALAGLALLGLPIIGYGSRDWLCFGLMALVPTLIGHTSFNHALRWIDAGRVSALTLSEPFFAGAVAWLAWNEPITSHVVAGYALVMGAVLVLVSERLLRSRPVLATGAEEGA